MTKYLVIILTSSKLIFLKECYNSVKNQLPSGIDYDIIINVNTLNNSYYEEVLKELSEAIVIRTESDGSAGKGHNSCYEYFKEHLEYSHMINIDGDDFLYPFFMQRLEHYLPYNPDVIMLPFTDVISDVLDKNALHYPTKKAYYYLNLDEMNLMEKIYKYKCSPFSNDLINVNVPGRVLLTSRKALDINFKYQEKIKAIDDLLPFLQIFEYDTINPHKLNIYFVADYYLYIYNRINNDSTSAYLFSSETAKKFKEISIEINKEIKNKFLSIRNWNLRTIKVLYNPPPDKNLLHEKFKFGKSLINRLNVPVMQNLEISESVLNNYHEFLVNNGYSSLYKVHKADQ